MDSPIFQRLRGIKQLSYAHLVYPGAVHTRFEHSLGAMHVAGAIAEKVGLDPDETELLRLGLLVHDIGHGPFSHSFEDVLQQVTGESIDHEDISLRLINNDPTLSESLDDRKDDVVDLLEGDKTGILDQVISGGLDADKLDYLRRDSFHTGVQYGSFDFHRVLECMDSHDGNLVVLQKGINALEGFKLSRFSLHTQVYNHHARAIAEEMLGRAAQLGVEDGHIPEEAFALNRQNYDDLLDRYGLWGPFSGDHAFERFIYDKADGRSLDLMTRVKERRLLKPAFKRHLTDLPPLARGTVMNDGFDARGMEETLAQDVDVKPHTVFVVVQRIDTKQYEGSLGGSEDTPILIKPRDGEDLKEHDSYPVVKGPDHPPHRLLVYGPEGVRDDLEDATQSYLDTIG